MDTFDFPFLRLPKFDRDTHDNVQLEDNSLLKDLGYDLNISSWTHLFAILNQAVRDEAAFNALRHSLGSRSKEVEHDELSTGQLARLLFANSVKEVARKAHACSTVTWIVYHRAQRQVKACLDQIVAQPGVNVEYDGDSELIPVTVLDHSFKFNEIQSELLKQLGYNLNPSTWPELYVLDKKAHEDEASLRALEGTINDQLARASNLAKHGNNGKLAARTHLLDGIASTLIKLCYCSVALWETYTRARQQAGVLLDTLGNPFLVRAELKVDSVLVPGKPIIFHHDLPEMIEFFRSAKMCDPPPEDDGELSDDGSFESTETRYADGDGSRDETDS
ncbi:MAG: hypothetical protein Q9184_007845 [Pyrenodesmia sp. 2 TL-2023]